MLNTKQRQALKARAHSLKPIVMLGMKGLTESVIAEINIALDTHELVKVKMPCDKADRTDISEAIIASTQAEKVQHIGHIITIYREKTE